MDLFLNYKPEVRTYIISLYLKSLWSFTFSKASILTGNRKADIFFNLERNKT